MAAISVVLTLWMALVVGMLGLILWTLVRMWPGVSSLTQLRAAPLLAFEPPRTRGAGTRPPSPRIPDVFARMTTSTDFASIIQGSPIQNNWDPNITNGNGGGRNPFAPHDVPEAPHVAPEVPLNECLSYGSIPSGYARWTRSGLVFHDPQRCQDCQGWSSDETESFDLSEDGLDLEAIRVVKEEALE